MALSINPQAALSRLVRGAKEQLSKLSASVFNGEITPAEFGTRTARMLEDWHGYAGYLGRAHAGDEAPFDEDDRKFGRLIVNEAGGQIDYLSAFVEDLESGRYPTQEAIRARANLYAHRLVGTANEAWSLSQYPTTFFTWHLGAAESCEDCISYANSGPYTEETLPAYPGDGQSQCNTNCKCYLTTNEGQTGLVLE